jgi:predicted transposase YbfD/YdcC
MVPCECRDDLTCVNCLWAKREQAKAEGRREALEEAAKVADALVAECDAHSGVGNLQSTKFREAASSHWVSMSNGAEEVASRIRALKDKP